MYEMKEKFSNLQSPAMWLPHVILNITISWLCIHCYKVNNRLLQDRYVLEVRYTWKISKYKDKASS